MGDSKVMFIVSGGILLLLLIIIISLGFFNVWIFFGLLFYVGLYLGGYIFVMVSFNHMEESRINDSNRKAKFDWCIERVNKILTKMPGGQGLEWDQGTGRVSEFKSYFDGVQNKPFRSMLGYLAKSQQLVLIIYDIDNDDIVRFNANPSNNVVEDHFFSFNPFKRETGFSGGQIGRPQRYDKYGRKVKSSYHNKGISIHMNDGDDGVDSYENMNRPKPDKDAIENAVGRL